MVDGLGALAGRYWVTIFLWVVVLVLVAGREARGDEWGRGRGIAGMRHVAAQEVAEDCSAVRAVESRARREFQQVRANLRHNLEAGKAKRIALEACGKSQGITEANPEEKLLAEVCPEEYDSWLRTGYRISVDNEDREDAIEGIQALDLYLDWNCPKLPSVQAVSVEVEKDLTVD